MQYNKEELNNKEVYTDVISWSYGDSYTYIWIRNLEYNKKK
jgi:hypothetical protein